MKMLTGKLPQTAILALGACLLVIAMLTATAAGADNAAGVAVYKSKCVTCHGADGAGSAVGKSLKVADLRSAEVQSRSDAELTQIISDGKNNMPGFKGTVSDDEITAVLAHVRTFAAKGDSASKKK
jgi:cytochrome c6